MEHRVYHSLYKPLLFCGVPPMLVIATIATNLVFALVIIFFLQGEGLKVSGTILITSLIILYRLRKKMSKDPKYAELLWERLNYDRKFLFRKTITYYR